MTNTRYIRGSKGFTLIELAVILIILGIILTTIIKGGEMVKSSKIKGMTQAQNDLQLAVMMYREKYGYLPGDDPLAVSHVGATASTVPSSSNGFIDNGERLWALHHLMKAELITGSYDGTNPMTNNYTTDISIKNVDFQYIFPTGTIVYTLPDGSVTTPGIPAVVYKDLPYEVAQELEFAFDGYDNAATPTTSTFLTGTVRGSKNYISTNRTIPFTYVALYPVVP